MAFPAAADRALSTGGPQGPPVSSPPEMTLKDELVVAPEIRQRVGKIFIEGDDFVSEMSGDAGVFRKKAWNQTDRAPIVSIRAISILDSGKTANVRLWTKPWGTSWDLGYAECKPIDAAEELVLSLLQRNPDIVVNDEDVAFEARAARDRANEVVGTERVATIPRYLLLGPLVAIAFKKRQVIRRKDVE